MYDEHLQIPVVMKKTETYASDSTLLDFIHSSMERGAREFTVIGVVDRSDPLDEFLLTSVVDDDEWVSTPPYLLAYSRAEAVAEVITAEGMRNGCKVDVTIGAMCVDKGEYERGAIISANVSLEHLDMGMTLLEQLSTDIDRFIKEE